MKFAQHNLNPKQQRAKQRALALAALTQALSLVQSIAQEGKCDHALFACCMDAFFAEDYIGERVFYTGAIKAKRLLKGEEVPYAKHILAHSAALLNLERKLAKQPETLEYISNNMQRIHKQVQYFNDPYHGNIISAIAHLYGETISGMNPKIVIRGKSEYLKQVQNTEKIRCLLFTSIRAAWVWRTHGGNTLHLIFGRKKLARELEHIRLST
jgi:high frequency lysogenization protein